MREFAKFYSYENIPLKMFTDITDNKNYKQLIISGRADEEKLAEVWEGIIAENSKASGEFEYMNYLEELRMYASTFNEYNLINSLLLKASVVKDQETLDELENLGYRVDISSPSALKASIKSCYARLQGVVTDLEIQMAHMTSQDEDAKRHRAMSFEELLANVSAGMGFAINGDVTLARFNEYKKIIRKRNG